MKAVEFSFATRETGYVQMPDAEVSLDRLISYVGEGGPPLWVRYDNGQLCKFKRKSK